MESAIGLKCGTTKQSLGKFQDFWCFWLFHIFDVYNIFYALNVFGIFNVFSAYNSFGMFRCFQCFRCIPHFHCFSIFWCFGCFWYYNIFDIVDVLDMFVEQSLWKCIFPPLFSISWFGISTTRTLVAVCRFCLNVVVQSMYLTLSMIVRTPSWIVDCFSSNVESLKQSSGPWYVPRCGLWWWFCQPAKNYMFLFNFF